jgi:hypothetical protein
MASKKKYPKLFCLLLFEAIGIFYRLSFFKDKKSRSHKTAGIKIFLLLLVGDRRIRTSN